MKKNQKLSLIFLVIGSILLIGALVIGISDNPPGIALLYISVVALILAFVHRWRKVKNFLILAFASIIGLLVFAILHNLFEALGEMTDIMLLSQLIKFLSVSSFFIALLICPVGLLIGFAGGTVLYFKNKKRPDVTS